jgi:hypothetical protein
VRKSVCECVCEREGGRAREDKMVSEKVCVCVCVCVCVYGSERKTCVLCD